MEAITEGVSNLNVSEQKKNRIQVSNTKKSLFFYVNLAKVVSYQIKSNLSYPSFFHLFTSILLFYLFAS